ncbi:YdbL family protein [bacterium SCSIO 12696]|nr:YdbL family protein [bacterium SCSIO 12696]
MFKKLLLGVVLVVAGIAPALAMDLKQAKDSGLVGERNDGYVGYVVKPPRNEVVAIVKQVNNKRKAKFASTAKNNGITVEQVAARFYQRAVGMTKSGNYYQDASGRWVKK